MQDEGNGIIRLRSCDDKVFELTESAAEISELLKDSPREEDDQVTEIDIVRVASPCLEKVVEFMKHYDKEKMKEIPTPLGASTFNEVMDQPWYQDFVSDEKVNRDMLFSMLSAANFLGIKPLLELTCLKVTFQITGKNAEEIRKHLHLPELTPGRGGGQGPRRAQLDF
ncbi:unnamed protein product [Cylindrotheca closterium]|uniref:S-phase kinase-associated protein 1 n=1 Tax=Cylindrotheca closterium TaxID=2856 RepID=A0AAD2CJM6_9STRA|nr:unnamed protein product [Cylindrotheca closterium]